MKTKEPESAGGGSSVVRPAPEMEYTTTKEFISDVKVPWRKSKKNRLKRIAITANDNHAARIESPG